MMNDNMRAEYEISKKDTYVMT
ncbi:hypothetical protein F383_18123 [Gossypium arboreum]|uniref:Uncharacterized protein n=1 Tax=Gossypium arboreum TaxID=29729 RepID=A0A0B0MJA1_GOSAR|nr:hypothetical protein F383_18123 [Gossypium arboreum]